MCLSDKLILTLYSHIGLLNIRENTIVKNIFSIYLKHPSHVFTKRQINHNAHYFY